MEKPTYTHYKYIINASSFHLGNGIISDLYSTTPRETSQKLGFNFKWV